VLQCERITKQAFETFLSNLTTNSKRSILTALIAELSLWCVVARGFSGWSALVYYVEWVHCSHWCSVVHRGQAKAHWFRDWWRNLLAVLHSVSHVSYESLGYHSGRNWEKQCSICICLFIFCKLLIFTCESSYCFQRVLAIAILSVRPSVCLSVCLSVTWVDQSKTVQARITKSSLSAAWKTLVSGTVKLFHKFEGGHPERER